MSGALPTAERLGILEGLENPDEEVRRLAVEQLLLLPLDEAVDRLCACLGDASWRVRKAAVERLVRCGHDPRLQDRLVVALADGENPGRRNAAFEAIVAFGVRATERLVREIGSADVDVRKLVVDALAAIGDPASAGPLREALRDPDANVRAAAAEAFGVVAAREDFEPLLALSNQADEEVLVRLSSLRALAGMEADVRVEQLGDLLHQSLLRPAASQLLGFSSDPEAIESLLKGLGSGSRAGRAAAMAALLRTFTRLDDVAQDRLVERLREMARSESNLVAFACERLAGADLSAQMVLVQFLGLLDDERAVRPILACGEDEAVAEVVTHTLESMGATASRALVADWASLGHAEKRRACEVLGRIGDETAEEGLSQALSNSQTELRIAAAQAIGEGGIFGRMPDLVYALEAATRADDPEGQEEVDALVAAVVSLGAHPEAVRRGIDLQLVELLAGRLGGAALQLRLAIAEVLARVGRAQDDDLVAILLKDAAPDVRRAAVGALERFDFDRVQDALRVALVDEASVVRIAAATVLGRSARIEVVDDLVRQLADEDARVVAASLRSIGRLHRGRGLGDPAMADVFQEALGREALVALAALEALVEIGGVDVARLAEKGFARAEADVSRSAVACAGAHGDEATLAAILPLLSHADWAVRAEAIQAISDRRYAKGLPALLRRLEVEDDSFVRAAALRAVDRLEA